MRLIGLRVVVSVRGSNRLILGASDFMNRKLRAELRWPSLLFLQLCCTWTQKSETNDGTQFRPARVPETAVE